MARTKQTPRISSRGQAPTKDFQNIRERGPTRSYRYKPGTVALREIRKLQQSTHPLIPRLAFQRLIKEIALFFESSIRFQSAAIRALQESAEYYLARLFEEANLCAIHAGRVTIRANDIGLARRLTSGALRPSLSIRKASRVYYSEKSQPLR